jgi:hypothetical protein
MLKMTGRLPSGMPMPVSETSNSKFEILVDARGYSHGAAFGKLDRIVGRPY